MCEKLYGTAEEEFESGDYDGAISSLEKVVKMDEGYQDGKALLLLAQTFEKKGEQEKANIRYQKLVEKYKATASARTAQTALDEQNSQKSRDGQNNQDGQDDQSTQDNEGDQDDQSTQDNEGDQEDQNDNE